MKRIILALTFLLATSSAAWAQFAPGTENLRGLGGVRLIVMFDRPTRAEALDEVIAENYDIIFMDIQLPDMNGFELTATIRLLERNNKRLPIVAVTANYLENMAQKCKEAGFDDFMLKPLTVDAVRHMLEKHLSRLGLNPIES